MSSLRAAPAHRPRLALILMTGLVGAAAVGPWIPWGLGDDAAWRKVYHLVVIGQAWLPGLLCLGIWNGDGRSDRWGRALACLALPAITVLAWLRYAAPNELTLAAAEGVYVALITALLVLGLAPRWRDAAAAPSVGTRHWLWVSALLGLAGAAGVSTYSTLQIFGTDTPWLVHQARTLLFQLSPLALTLGVVPRLLSRPRDVPTLPTLLLGSALLASAPLELVSPWAGLLLRGGSAAALLVLQGIATRKSVRDRPLLALAALSIPLGYAIAALPTGRDAGLHVVFIGAFAMGGLATVAPAVRRLPIWAAVLVSAAILRALAGLDSPPIRPVTAVAALTFITGLGIWVAQATATRRR